MFLRPTAQFSYVPETHNPILLGTWDQQPNSTRYLRPIVLSCPHNVLLDCFVAFRNNSSIWQIQCHMQYRMRTASCAQSGKFMGTSSEGWHQSYSSMVQAACVIPPPSPDAEWLWARRVWDCEQITFGPKRVEKDSLLEEGWKIGPPPPNMALRLYFLSKTRKKNIILSSWLALERRKCEQWQLNINSNSIPCFPCILISLQVCSQLFKK